MSLPKKLFTVTLLFLTLIITSSPVTLGQTIATVDTSIIPLMVEKKVPGLSYAIVKNGEIIRQKSFGVTNLDQNSPETNNTAHYIASTT